MALIPLSEYARKHRRSEVSLRQLAARRNLPTAQKIGSQGVVDADAPYPDYRHSSDRASNVLTLVAPENVSSVFSRITESTPKYGVFLDVFDIRQNPHLKTQMIHIPLTTHVISHSFGVQDPIKSFGTVSRLRRRNGRDLGLLIPRTSRRSYQLKRLNLTIC